MSAKKLVLAVLGTLALSLFLGFGLGRLIFPAPDPAPFVWEYRGWVHEVSFTEDDAHLTIRSSETARMQHIRIPATAQNLGEHTLEDLIPGTYMVMMLEFYEYDPEVVYVAYEITEIDR